MREPSPIWGSSPTLDRDLRKRLLLAEQPLPRFELTFQSPAARLFYALRCRVPFALKALIAELLGRVDRWRKPAELAEARVATEAIVGGTRLSGQVEAIARRRLVEERLREAAFWRARFDRGQVVGAANMHGALAQGRGVILSFCHVGSFHGSLAPLSRDAGRTTYIATNSWFLEPPDGSEWSLRIEHWRRRLAAIDGRIVQMPGTFQTLGALLERGEVAMLAFDMPGNSETRFLGKPVMLTSGTAKLALKTDALVLPLRPVRRGLRLAIEFGRPIDPREHVHARSLQSAIARIHEEWILERPAALEDPTRPGAWEREALPSGWGSPRR